MHYPIMITELINLISLAEFANNLRGIFLSGKRSFVQEQIWKNLKFFFSRESLRKMKLSLRVWMLQNYWNLLHFPKYVIACIDGSAYAVVLVWHVAQILFLLQKILNSELLKSKLSPPQIAPYVINRIGRKMQKILCLVGKYWLKEP